MPVLEHFSQRMVIDLFVSQLIKQIFMCFTLYAIQNRN